MSTITVPAHEIRPGDRYQGHRVLRVAIEESVHVSYHPLDEAHGVILSLDEPVEVEREEFDVVGAIMAVEQGDASPLETLETLGYLIRSGLVSTLQGSWQRAVVDAIRSDFLDYSGNLTDHAIEALGDLDETEEF